MKQLKLNVMEMKFIQILSLEFEMKSIEENLKLLENLEAFEKIFFSNKVKNINIILTNCT